MSRTSEGLFEVADLLDNRSRDDAAIVSQHFSFSYKPTTAQSGPENEGPTDSLFNNADNQLQFDEVTAGDYLDGTQYNALGGNFV